VNNPKEGDKFGFVYEADGPVGRGYTKNPDGTVSPSGPLNHVYIQYQWVKGPGGKLVPKVKNVYPKQVPPAATAGNPGGPVVAGSPGDVPEDEDEGD
jgi:hypothetical protein